MKVIFIRDLRGKGRINEVKEFSDGFAINYLIKNKYAVKYTTSSSKRLDNDLDIIKQKEEQEINMATEIGKKIENISLKFIVKSGVNGKVFGSISSKQISDELNKKGYKIDKKSIKIDFPINSLGTHIISVDLHKKVRAKIKVELAEK